jgi:NADPH:quinone reductase-like Zn-dependent oxidoreductase
MAVVRLTQNSDSYMSQYGILVNEWPLVLGVDASGVVVEAGDVAKKEYGFKVGDYVCGCTRLGSKAYSTAQEYFLMDAHVTIPKPKNLSTLQAATLGVGIQTACLSIFDGLKINRPESGKVSQKDEWVLVMGGASSVGKSAIQLARAAGYKVIASCSSKSAAAVQALDASTFDYKKSTEEQVKEILKVTSGNVRHCFDAVASDDPVVPKALFKELDSSKPKLFSTTNDWSNIPSFEGGETHWTMLGKIGKPTEKEANQVLSDDIPLIVKLVEEGKVVTPEYEVIGDGGFEDAVKAYYHQVKGAGGSKKVVVKIQDE